MNFDNENNIEKNIENSKENPDKKGDKKPDKKTKKEKPLKKEKPPKKEKPLKSEVVKPERDDLYKIRKNRAMKLLRVVLWGMLFFVFIKGVIVSLRPDTEGEALQAISEFREEFSGYKELDSELLAFAENFAGEYLTYGGDADENDYAARLSRYAAKTVTDAVTARFAKGTSAKAVYVNAYRKVAYSDNQTDVYIVADVEYTVEETVVIPADPKTETPEIQTVIENIEVWRVTLKIPVAYSKNRYIVEDLPVFTNDDIKFYDYSAAEFGGKAVDDTTREAVLTYLNDFFKAYYEDKQSVIDVYLAPNADKDAFKGLDGLLIFEGIESSSGVYYPNEIDKTPLVALVTLKTTDKAGNGVTQNFTVTVIERDGRYYVRSLDTKINNLHGGY